MSERGGALASRSTEGGIRPLSLIFRILMMIVVFWFFIVMAMELFSFTEPYLFPLHMVKGQASSVGAGVIIGPYPNRTELRRLKDRMGVVEVISVLNPDIIVESRLLDRERRNATALGIRFKSRPLSWFMPYSAANKKATERIARYAVSKFGRSSSKKLYINCYLGRHRVNLVRTAIKRLEIRPKTP